MVFNVFCGGKFHKGRSAQAHRSHQVALVLLIWSLCGAVWAGLVPAVVMSSNSLVKALRRQALAEDHEHVGDPRPRLPHIREGDSGNGWVCWSCGFLVEMGPKVPPHCVHTRPWGLGNSGYTVWLRGYNLSQPQLWNGDNTIQLKGFSRRWNKSEHRAVRLYSNLCHLPCWLKVDTLLVKAAGSDTFY